ncbi:hypothetical protein GCM10010530_43550 [Kribbella aluminosa]
MFGPLAMMGVDIRPVEDRAARPGFCDKMKTSSIARFRSATRLARLASAADHVSAVAAGGDCLAADPEDSGPEVALDHLQCKVGNFAVRVGHDSRGRRLILRILVSDQLGFELAPAAARPLSLPVTQIAGQRDGVPKVRCRRDAEDAVENRGEADADGLARMAVEREGPVLDGSVDEQMPHVRS